MSNIPNPGPFSPRVPRAHAVAQPLQYPLQREWVEPDWRRLPGYRDVSRRDWESAQWQRAHTVKNLRQLRAALGELLPDSLIASIERDQAQRATMSMLLPPQMLNTMNERDLWRDPVRRYMLPALDDRDSEWPSHPLATRDSLHEADMWAVEGLTHRYPTKVLAEVLATCPQYCGHCTRMDLVGNSTPQVDKYKFQVKQPSRHDQILDYLRSTPSVRDVVVSGGDIANLPIRVLEGFVSQLLDIENIRDIRLATKGLMGIPQHFLQDDVLQGLERLARKAHDREVDLAVHTHVNHANQLTPLVGKVVRKLLDMGFRDVRNQVRDAEGGLRRAVRGQAMDPSDRVLRPREGHLVLDQELPHRHRVRRPGRPEPPVRVLRPHPLPARLGQGVLAALPFPPPFAVAGQLTAPAWSRRTGTPFDVSRGGARRPGRRARVPGSR